MSEIEDLHNSLFGFLPEKSGAAYERIAALMMAALGWKNVRHDERARGTGRRAKHQLDVTATNPAGSVHRFIIECKDYDKKAGKDVLDKLVGVREQLDADAAAAITTVGFTKGARDVASDEDVALVRMHPFDPETATPYVKVVQITLQAWLPERSAFDLSVEANPDHPAPLTSQISLNGESRLRFRDGSPAETFDEILRAHGAPMKNGTFDCVAPLEGGRLVQTALGHHVVATEMRWKETMHSTEDVVRVEAEGEPCLVMEQLNDNGSVASGKVLADRDLYAWTLDESGSVVARSDLLSRPE